MRSRDAWQQRVAGAALGAAILSLAAVELVNVYPFAAITYYNALAGGPRGATALGLSPVLWAMADASAVEELNRRAAPDDVIYDGTGATLPLRAYRALGRLRSDLRFGNRPDWVVLEYNLAYSNWYDWWLFFDDRHPWYERVRQVEVAGAPILGVFRARTEPLRANGAVPFTHLKPLDRFAVAR